jgi:hypothetical protein
VILELVVPREQVVNLAQMVVLEPAAIPIQALATQHYHQLVVKK